MSDFFAIPDATKEMLEAVLFAAGHPVTYAKLAQILEVSPDEAKSLVEDYAAEYNDGKVTRGIQLLTFDDCCQLCTKPDYSRGDPHGTRHPPRRQPVQFLAGSSGDRRLQSAGHPRVHRHCARCGFELCGEFPD